MWLFDHGVMTDEKGLIKVLRTTRQRGNPEPSGRGQVQRKPQFYSMLQHPLVSIGCMFHKRFLRHIYFNDAKKSNIFKISDKGRHFFYTINKKKINKTERVRRNESYSRDYSFTCDYTFTLIKYGI